jgi:hypothetical protein
MLEESSFVYSPSRSVTATIEAKRKDPVYTGLIDIKWDAGLDKSKQLFVDAELMYKNIDGRVSQEQEPSRPCLLVSS